MSASPVERVGILRRRLARAEDAEQIADIIAAAADLAERTRNEVVRAACGDVVARARVKAAKISSGVKSPNFDLTERSRQARFWVPPPGCYAPQLKMIVSDWSTDAEGTLTRFVYADPTTPWRP